MTFDQDFLVAKAKLAALGFVGAVLSILTTPPKTTWGRVAAVVCGVAVATVATAETIEIMGLSERATTPLAAAYGIGGYGLVAWIGRLYSDPLAALRELRGALPREPGGDRN